MIIVRRWTSEIAATVALVFAPWVAAHAAEPEVLSTLTTKWKVSLDAAGHVVDLDPVGNVAPKLAAPLQQRIRAWQFAPGTRDGVPMPTETTLVVDMAFTSAAGDRLDVSIRRAATGGNALPEGSDAVPRYPMSALRKRQQGLALVEVRYDGAGRIVGIGPYRQAPRISPALTDAAIEAVRHWRIAPEMVGGIGVPGELVVPVCVIMDRAGQQPDCHLRLPELDRKAQANQALALTSVTGVASDVVNETL